MYARKPRSLLPGCMLLAGILGMGLRILLNRCCTDQRLLLPAAHPLGITLGLLTAAALGAALYAALKLEKLEGYQKNFPPSWRGGWGHIIAALGILLTVLGHGSEMRGNLGQIWKTLAFASIPCLIVSGWLRKTGKQPFFLLHLCPTIFLVMHTVNQYQRWSSDPQLLNYFFSLFGIICMVMFAFYRSAFDVGLPWRRRLTFLAMSSTCLGIMALPGCSYPWLYLGMALWAILDLPANGEPAEVHEV